MLHRASAASSALPSSGEPRASTCWATSGWRRALDIVLAAFLLVLMLPLLVVTGILVKATSSGPMLYRQCRVGLEGRTFEIYKFRSMVQNAEADGKAQWACANDPRITRFGRLIRMVRIDELPQLFNVLRGEMSLIGPRPERPEFVAELSGILQQYDRRHSVLPGITGLAQVQFVYAASIEDARIKLRYDLEYVDRCSPTMDLKILLKTILVIVGGKGAH